ncbi:MAG: N-acetyltransferase [Flavobacteriaceae bacterium]|nr:N-acetyltransferase [Flavobacteriaceae bacterium]
MIRYKLVTSEKELKQILELQRENLPSNISEEEKLQEGFVTVNHTFALLNEMNDACPHTIATHNSDVIGYALSMHPKFGDSIEVLKPMFAEIQKYSDQLFQKPNNFLVMGQICISKDFRRKGIFRELYFQMKHNFIPPYEAIITEVDTANKRSLQAHYAVGFKQITMYSSGGQDWDLLILR